MKTIIGAMLSQEEKVKEGAYAYLDDIYVNEDILLSLHFWIKLVQFGLICKDPERLENGVRVLGLDVYGEEVLMSKTVPFQTIQFNISTQFKCNYTV